MSSEEKGSTDTQFLFEEIDALVIRKNLVFQDLGVLFLCQH